MTEGIEDRGYTPAERVGLDFVADYSASRNGAREGGVNIAQIDLKYCADGPGLQELPKFDRSILNGVY